MGGGTSWFDQLAPPAAPEGRERDEAAGCNGNCSCVIGSRHMWHEAFCKERQQLALATQEIARLREKAEADMKLVDELLCDLKSVTGQTWPELERHTSTTRVAMQRLREADQSQELAVVTLGLIKHLRGTKLTPEGER